MGRSPFAGVGTVQLAMPRIPYLRPRNIERDLSKPAERQIVKADEAEYILRIDQVDFKTTEAGADYVMAEFTVIACTNAVTGDGSNPPGSKAVYQIMRSWKSFTRDFVMFVCTAMNFPPGNFTEAMSEQVVSAYQPLTKNNRYVKVKVSNSNINKKTKLPKNDWTQHDWSPLEATLNSEGQLMAVNPPARDEVTEYIRVAGQIADSK